MRGALIKIGAELARVVAVVIALHAVAAVASSVGGSAMPGTGSGSLVGADAPTLTGAVVVTGPTGSLTVSSATTFTGTSGNGSVRINAPSGTNGLWSVALGAAEAVYAESANNASSQACQCAGITNGNGVLGTGTGSGAAITATNSAGGMPLVVNGDTTSPAVGQIRMPVLDTNPTSCQVGDVFMFTGGILRVCTATTPTWVNVGSQ
jgi:hypothetical protein